VAIHDDRERVYLEKGPSLDRKFLSNELLAEIPQLSPIVTIANVGMQLFLGDSVIV
jgi:hypothetical protein